VCCVWFHAALDIGTGIAIVTVTGIGIARKESIPAQRDGGNADYAL
jgi:hypothetical protein